MTPTLFLTAALLFPPQPAIQAEGRVTVKGVKVGIVAVRRADIDYVVKTDGSVRATGTAILSGDVTAKLVYLVGDVNTGRYTARMRLLGGEMDLDGRLVDLLKQLIPE